MINNRNELVSAIVKWEVGDKIDLSENQKFVIKEKRAVSILTPFPIPYCTPEQLSSKIREFIGTYKELCIKFIQQENKIVQQIVSANDVKLKIKYRETDSEEKLENLKQEGTEFLKEECDVFNGELIRVIVFGDRNKKEQLFIVMGIHYSLIDMHTNIYLSDHLKRFLYSEPIDLNYVSNFDFVLWQKEFISSREGIEKRKYWINLLRQANLDKAVKRYSIDENITIDKGLISQRIIISGNELQAIKEILTKSNLPLSAILLTFHQRLIRLIFKDENCLQLVRVNGRERLSNNFDVSNVFGMITNAIPLPVFLNVNLADYDLILKAYSLYFNARLNQQIPFEIIKADFEKEENKDINSSIIGLFNFVNLEEKNKINLEDNYNYLVQKKRYSPEDNRMNLYCTLYQNSLEIEFTCKSIIYEDNKEILNLKKLIENEFMNSFL